MLLCRTVCTWRRPDFVGVLLAGELLAFASGIMA